MKLIKRKLNNRNGFSLAETLVAVLIILLVSSVVAAGMPAAQKAYNNVLQSADAQLFMSTLLTELRNELATANNIEINNNTVTYDNPVTGSSKIAYDSSTGVIEITNYMDLGNATSRQIVTESARTKALSLAFTGTDSFSYEDDIFTVNGFNVISKTNSVLANMSGYSFNVLVPEEQP